VLSVLLSRPGHVDASAVAARSAIDGDPVFVVELDVRPAVADRAVARGDGHRIRPSDPAIVGSLDDHADVAERTGDAVVRCDVRPVEVSIRVERERGVREEAVAPVGRMYVRPALPAVRSIRAAPGTLGEADELVVEPLLCGPCERRRRSDDQGADDDSGCKDSSQHSCPPMRTARITYARGRGRRRDFFAPYARPTHSEAYRFRRSRSIEAASCAAVSFRIRLSPGSRPTW